MSIDWITVAAQLANFLVLVWLLKRFLYRPILDGIDARDAEITERMQVAVRAKEEAAEAEAHFRDQLARFQADQASVADAARHEAEQARDALMAEAHERIEQEHAGWRAHLDEETRSFTQKMHRAGGHALLELTRKALKDLADDTLEARMAARLGRQIAAMDQELQHAAGPVEVAVITSHATLPPAVEEDVTEALRGSFPGIDVRFEKDETQAPGLSLQLGGAQLAWTVDTYIDGLDALMSEQLAVGSDVRA